MSFRLLYKKIIASSLAVVIAMSVIGANYVSASEKNGCYIFNHGSDEGVKVSGGTQHAVFSEDSGTVFGEALNIKPLCVKADGLAQIPINIYDESFDFSATKGIAMYLKLPKGGSNTNFTVRLIKHDWSPDWYSIGINKTFTFVEIAGYSYTKTEKTQKLPLENMQGFEGYVFIPYETLTDGSAPVDKSRLTKTGWTVEISLFYPYEDCTGRDYYVDEIGFYDDIDGYVQKSLAGTRPADCCFNSGGSADIAVYGGSDISISLDKSNSPFGSALKITPKKTYGGGWAQIPVRVSEDYNFEGAKGIAMYASFPEDSVGLNVAVRLINKAWSEWFTLGHEKPIVLISSDSRKETTTLKLSAALSGFEGFVFIPFESMTEGSLPSVQKTHLNGKDWNIEIGYYAYDSENIGADFIFDEFGFYSDEEEYIRKVSEERLGFALDFGEDGFVSLEETGITAKRLKASLSKGYYDSIEVLGTDGNSVNDGAAVSTGMKLSFVLDGEAKSFNIVVERDINCDSAADIRDLIHLKKGIAKATVLSHSSIRAASKAAKTAKTLGATELATLKKAVLGAVIDGSGTDIKDFKIVENGVAKSKIVINKGSSAAQSAANDLVARIKEMTGVSIPIVSDEMSVSTNAIIIGNNKQAEALGLEIPSGFPQNEGFRIYCDEKTLLLAGNDDGCFTGSQFAVNYLLEMLGFGWYGTDSLWNVKPKAATVTVPHINLLSKPDFGSRYTNVSYSAHSVSNRWYMGGYESEVDHKLGYILPPDEYYEEHPEYYALSSGTRSPYEKRWWQLCLSNQEVQQLVAEKCISFFATHPNYVGAALGQNDGSGDVNSPDYANWCECADCKAFADNFTESMMKFCNIVGELIAEECPGKTLMYYGYYETFDAPDTDMTAESNVLMMLCKQGGMTRFVSYENMFNSHMGDTQFADNFRSWRNLGYKHMGIYEWNCPGAASNKWKDSFWVQGDVFIENARWFKKRGVDFIKIDQGPNPYYERESNYFDIRWPLWYVNSVTMYDSSRTFEEILRPACDKLYGDAGAAMFAFYDALNRANRSCSAANHTWGLPEVRDIYTSSYISQIDSAINRAKQLGELIGGDVAARINNQYNNWLQTKTYI